jgi:hypothetical protein
LLYFRTPPASNVSRTITVALYADMGASDVSDPVMRQLLALRDQDAIDFVVHNGDISYADGYESLGDQFMRKIEPLAAYVRNLLHLSFLPLFSAHLPTLKLFFYPLWLH